MPLIVRLVEEARREIVDATNYYGDVYLELGERFREELRRGLMKIVANPGMYSLRAGGWRRLNLREFLITSRMLSEEKASGLSRLLMPVEILLTGFPG